jgi:hypothetical protein
MQYISKIRKFMRNFLIMADFKTKLIVQIHHKKQYIYPLFKKKVLVEHKNLQRLSKDFQKLATKRQISVKL